MLSGECRLLVEGQERPLLVEGQERLLQQWDFVHFPV